MHEEMQKSQPVSSTYGTTTPTNVDKDKEEQLWAQQRLVTALKRKVQLLNSLVLKERLCVARSNKRRAVYNRTDCPRS